MNENTAETYKGTVAIMPPEVVADEKIQRNEGDAAADASSAVRSSSTNNLSKKFTSSKLEEDNSSTKLRDSFKMTASQEFDTGGSDDEKQQCTSVVISSRVTTSAPPIPPLDIIAPPHMMMPMPMPTGTAIPLPGESHEVGAFRVPNIYEQRRPQPQSSLTTSGEEITPVATSARLVPDEDDVERLRAELESIHMAPEAEVVTTTEPTQSFKRQLTAAVGIIILLIIAIVVVVALVATRHESDDQSGTKTSTSNAGPASEEETPIIMDEILPQQPVLQTIKERGFIRCYVNFDELLLGYGLSLELCRALSAAIFDGDANRTEFPLIDFKNMWSALDNGTLDISTSHVTFTMGRDVYEESSKRPKSFSTIFFYTGTIFAGVPEMVQCAERGDTLTGDCRNLVVCVHEASTTVGYVREQVDGTGIHLVSSQDHSFQLFVSGVCNVMASEPQELSSERVRNAGYTGEYTMGTLLLSHEPLAMVTRFDDAEWMDFANAILQSLFTAEVEGITQQTASLLFPTTAMFGDDHKNMFQHAISTVGNWGELYNRTFGVTIPQVGKNRLVNAEEQEAGGLMKAPPLGALDFAPTLQSDIIPRVIANSTLAKIGQRGYLRCGILPERPGFATEGVATVRTSSNYSTTNTTTTEANATDITSNMTTITWIGMDTDMCRCLGATLFDGDTSDDVVEFVLLEDATAGYLALANDLVDMVAGIPYSLEADIKEPTTQQGYTFSPVYYYHDGSNNNDEMLTLATNQKAHQWSDFVRWVVYGLIYAEENGIGRDNASLMPSVDLFGPSYNLMFRLMVLHCGNYGDIYNANLGELVPRSGHNLLHNGSSPLILPLPMDQFK